MTPLDRAFTEMAENPDDDHARLKFYERVADAELFLIMADETQPRVYSSEQGKFVAAFDLEERLASFNEGPAPYAALSGRSMIQMVTGQEIGIALNFWSAPSAYLLTPDVVEWLNATLAVAPSQHNDTPVSIGPPLNVPTALLESLDAKLAAATGLAEAAFLVSTSYKTGRQGHLLAILGAPPEAEPSLSQAIAEAIVFSGIEAGDLDVAFFRSDDPIRPRLEAQGLRFDIPQPERPKPLGRDPDTPPRLR